MKRYHITEYQDASPASREVYDDYMRTTGATKPPLWLKSLGYNEALARAYWERAKGTLFSGDLPLPLKEMIVFVVSAQHGAKYCSACHADCVLNLDKTIEFGDLQSFMTNAGNQLPPYYRGVVKFATKIAVDPNSVTDEDFGALMDEGFSRAEVGEIISVIDMATMFNVYTSALRLELDPEYRAVL
jgi:alkylhydroperoxidase family enzyme